MTPAAGPSFPNYYSSNSSASRWIRRRWNETVAARLENSVKSQVGQSMHLTLFARDQHPVPSPRPPPSPVRPGQSPLTSPATRAGRPRVPSAHTELPLLPPPRLEMGAPSLYTLLPNSPVDSDPEKASSAPSSPPPPSRGVSSYARVWAFALAGAISVGVLVVVLYAGPDGGLLQTAMRVAGGACGSVETADVIKSVGTDSIMKNVEGTPRFSTSVYPNGETSEFVYTTRPIVRPSLSPSWEPLPRDAPTNTCTARTTR